MAANEIDFGLEMFWMQADAPGRGTAGKVYRILGREALKQAFPGLHFMAALCYNGT